MRKSTLKEMQDIAKTMDGKCLSKKYVNSHIKLRWKCKKGHVWEAIPSNIKQGHWCPKCKNTKIGDSLRLNIEEMQDIAKERGGECLSKKYTNSWTKLRWRCKEGHVWKSTPNNIKHQGSWCPICARKKR
jgi:hypothetical protein